MISHRHNPESDCELRTLFPWPGALTALACTLVLALAFAATARADYEQVPEHFGDEGHQLQNTTAVAVNSTGAGGVEAGSLYVVGRNGRVQRYSPGQEGQAPAFKEAWGWNTVGPDSPQADQSSEVQAITVRGTSGTFKLSFGAGGPGISETTELPASATAAEVQTALNALANVSAGGGSVAVSGGPGDATGSHPYEVTFSGGPLAHHDVAQIVAASLSLGGGIPASAVGAVTTSPGEGGYETCRPASGDQCTGVSPNTGGGEEVGNFNAPAGVAVDQGTGYVYVLNSFGTGRRERNLIEVFDADGSNLVTRFGDDSHESIADTPEQLHNIGSEDSGIAVDAAGTAYVSDGDWSGGLESRVPCFRPQTPGDYAHYTYCGSSDDVKLGRYISRFALDGAGNLYATNEEWVKAYELASPTAGPICSFTVQGAGAKSLTANPLTGEVFYFKYSDKRIHRLGPCNPATHKFAEAQEPVAPTPATSGILALAFDPTKVWGPDREPGVLYAADGTSHFEEDPPHEGVGDILAPAAEREPVIEAEAVSATTPTATTLTARIDPKGFATHFSFQYMTAAEYAENGESFEGVNEAAQVPLPAGGQIGGIGIGTATAPIAGLLPDTPYRFRVVASSLCRGAAKPACETIGEAAAFSTYPPTAPGLADQRAYELVSPPQKAGGEVFPADARSASCGANCKPPGTIGTGGRFPMQAAPDGEGVVYEGYPFSASAGSAVFNSYLSKRTPEGWQTTALSPALQDKSSPQGHLGFSAELGAGLIYQGPGVPALTPSAPPSTPNLYLQPSTATPEQLDPLVGAAPPNRAPNAFAIEYAGASTDFSHIFFTANDALTGPIATAPEPPDPGASGRDLYESHEGRLALVNVAPGNAAVLPDARIASQSPDNHAVSANGLHVFFNSGGQLYLREDGQSTQLVSASQRSAPDPAGPQPAQFWGASANGSRAIFASSEELTDDADTGPLRQSLVIDATGGSFKLGYEGQQSSPIALNTVASPKKPSAAEVQAVLEALPNIAPGEVEVSGGFEGGYTIARSGPLAQSEGLIEADGSALSGGGLSLSATRPGTDLYEWNQGALTDLTAGRGPQRFAGIAGRSEDLSHLYLVTGPSTGKGDLTSGSETVTGFKPGAGAFGVGQAIEGPGIAPGTTITALGTQTLQLSTPATATAASASLSAQGLLSSQPNSEGDTAAAARPDLYSLNGGSIAFVAGLLAGDGTAEEAGDWVADPVRRTAEASPAGRYLTFLSQAKLTRYENVGPACFLNSVGKYVSAPCFEAFLYDSVTGKLTCASCNPSGEAPRGRTTLRRISDAGKWLPQPRYLTDNGRLYFDSADRLSPLDNNGRVEDVYEFEPDGVGTCARPAGCLNLLSTGAGTLDANLLAVNEGTPARPGGSDVFFTTRERLNPKDSDELIDLYDAREGGGIAAEDETGRVECQGEACQPVPAASQDPTPASSAFHGTGNVKPRKKKQAHRKKRRHAKHRNRHRAHGRNKGGSR